MKELSDVEQLFVQEVLDTHGEYICDLMAEAIEDKKVIDTGALLDSLNYKVERRGGDFVLMIYFNTYGRFVEIEYYKSRAIRRQEQKTRNSLQLIRRPKKKDTRIYARIVYGTINRLLGRMSSEYSDAEIARLKGILEQYKE